MTSCVMVFKLEHLSLRELIGSGSRAPACLYTFKSVVTIFEIFNASKRVAGGFGMKYKFLCIRDRSKR